MTDKELMKMFGLYDRTIKLTLEDDILNIMNKHYKQFLEHEQEKKDFVSLFKECYDDIVKVVQSDSQRRIPVDCYTCIRGMDLSKQYGKPKKKH